MRCLGPAQHLTRDAAIPYLAQTYDPYGTVYASAGSGASSYGFTGEQVDPNGLVYLRARYYEPGMGRFLNMDPSGQEMNPYLYSTGNPINYVDPSGLCSSAGCTTGGGSDASNISVHLTITFPPELMTWFGNCEAEQAAEDFFYGVLDQLKLDMALQPYNMAINFVASIGPLPGLESGSRPFSAAINLATNTTLEEYRLNDAFWSGSGWYKTGRLTGRSISNGIGFALFVSGPPTFLAGITGEGLSIACEGLSGGLCTLLAGAGVSVSTSAVVVGVVETAYGGAILLANATHHVGGAGGRMPGSQGTQHTSKTHWTSKDGNTRLDSENPAPGQRAGQIHVQDKRYPGEKWYWKFDEGRFQRMPSNVASNITADCQNFRNALNNALAALGEKPVRGIC